MALSMFNLATTNTAATPAITLTGGQTATFINTGASNAVFLGEASGVTTSTGFLFPVNGQPVTISLPPTSSAVSLFAISAAGAGSLGIIVTSTA